MFNRHLPNHMKLWSVSWQVLGPPFCPGRPLGKLLVFLSRDKCCPFLSSGQKCLRSQEPGPFSFPPGSRDNKAREKLGQGNWSVGWKPIKRPGPGPLDPSSPHSLWVGPGCLRTCPGVKCTKPGCPKAQGWGGWGVAPSWQSAGSCWGHCLTLS